MQSAESRAGRTLFFFSFFFFIPRYRFVDSGPYKLNARKTYPGLSGAEIVNRASEADASPSRTQHQQRHDLLRARPAVGGGARASGRFLVEIPVVLQALRVEK